MKAKSLADLKGKGALVDQEGVSLKAINEQMKPIAEQLGVPQEKLLEVINANSRALLLIVEALASQAPAPQVTVNIPPVNRWVINITGHDKDQRISSLEIIATG